ncbi:CDP-glycerol glycerophosphotransferase family protein [uncultured Jatrophihabitans sp.]|uniref:CDP-glycerol glycerophosphotransferase family protein n=1 Tax=uncultured Jatrophihabitans sp. TaxID=1610747 RepID=UPI0035CBEE10
MQLSAIRSLVGRSGLGAVRRILLQRVLYRWLRRRPVDPSLAVFATYWYRGYGCNPAAIYERAAQTVSGFRGVWVVDREHANNMPAGVEFVVAGSPAYYRVLAQARVLVNNVNFPNYFVKRADTLHVQTHHGTPLKRMGLDLQGKDLATAPHDLDALRTRCARWDFSIAGNAYAAEIWSRSFPGTYRTLLTGQPRNDVLSRATADDRQRYREALGLEAGDKVLLYLPTHRDDEDTHVDRLDRDRLLAGLGDEWVALWRPHHRYTSSGAHAGRAGRFVDVGAYPSVEELYIAADVLVTDYSSAMFDFAILDKPIVIFAPDWEEYERERGVYFDLTEEPPGVVVRTTDQVVTTLTEGLHTSPDAQRNLAAFRDRFCHLEDGHAAQRVVQEVWET